MGASCCNMSVLMLPWLAHGHISPFLELAKELTNRNFKIYLCSTPITLIPIRESLSNSQYSSSIQLVELHLPSLPDLPPHRHTTKGLPPHLMPTLKKALRMSKPAFSHILDSLKPDMVIYDFIQTWAPVEASSRNIPTVQFICAGVATIAYAVHLQKTPNVPFPFPEIRLGELEEMKMVEMIETSKKDFAEAAEKDGGMSNDFNSSPDTLRLFKTNRMLEGEYIDYFSKFSGAKALPVGPLVRDPTSDDDVDKGENIIKWLDRKEKSSTVFVSFGSEFFLTKEDITEIAHGLELSGVNFIWVIRFPIGERIEIVQVLPNGFQEKVKDRGIVIEGWAPQMRILKHPSIGGFVSHCGWSSVMESLMFGVPIIAMPMQLDQPFNARLMEKACAVAMEVKRDKEGGFQRNEIAKVVEDVLVGKDGEALRRKVKEMSQKMVNNGKEEIDRVAWELRKLHYSK